VELKDYLNSINYSKEDIMVDSLSERKYPPFVINRCLSYFPDTIFHVNEMNMSTHIGNKMQYDFLRTSIRKRKRFSKWLKKEIQSQIDAVCHFYSCSKIRATEYISLLTEDQLNEIVQIYKRLNS